MRNNFTSLLLTCLFIICHGANVAQAQIIDREELSFDRFKKVLKDQHPILQLATIEVDNAQQKIRDARAAFDPKLQLGRTNKNFEQKEYLDYRNIRLDVPTWLGVDIIAGYNNNNGVFTNDEVTLGNSYFLGGEFSLTQGLYMNKRRALLQSAKLLLTAANQERKIAFNEIYYNAYYAYFNWLYEYLRYQNFNEIYELNLARYSSVVNSWKLGNAPAIDTTEALSQLQQFKLFRNESFIKYIEAGIDLSQHVWDSSMYMQLVQAKLKPDTLSIHELSLQDNSTNFWTTAGESHPKLNINDLKQEQLKIKQKLAYQQLLPNVSLGAYKIERLPGSILSGLNNDYQFNVGLEVPLRLSKGRAAYNLTKNGLLQNTLNRDYAFRGIQNAVLYQLNEINIAKSQISLYKQYLQNIDRLYQAENTKYRLGSSTIFLINSRENKLLDARLKRLKNLIHYQNSILKLYKEVVRLEEL